MPITDTSKKVRKITIDSTVMKLSTPSLNKDVKFIDPYGNVVTSISIEEAQTLTKLPEAPTFDGLVFQEWNWTLEEINSLTVPMVIGANYITDDGTTRVYIELNKKTGLNFTISVEGSGTVDWGDGNIQTYSSTNRFTHTYSEYGKYKVVVTELRVVGTVFNQPTSGLPSSFSVRKIELGKISSSRPSIRMFLGLGCLESITIPKNAKFSAGYHFSNCTKLKAIVIPHDDIEAGQSDWTDFAINCYSLKFVSFPSSFPTLSKTMFKYCYNLQEATIPINTTYNDAAFDSAHCVSMVYLNQATIPARMFYGCYSLVTVKNMSNVETISDSAFFNSYNLSFIDFSNNTVVPVIGSSIFKSGGLKIIVPDALYDEWIVATNWAEYEPYIYKASEVNV